MSSDTEATHSLYPNDDYTVGWICALPIEIAAAKGMMDEEHGDPQTPPQQADQNTYLLGRIGKCKVVVACLPTDKIGSSSAAAVAKDMLHTFPNIRIGLLVGIGAGIPYYDSDDSNDVRDIRLGDVVIGTDKKSSGVIAYDFGKILGDGSFETAYALDRPPKALRTALSLLQAEHLMRESKILDYIEKMWKRYPFMERNGYRHPGEKEDRLFPAEYPHQTGPSCTQCDLSQQISRKSSKDRSGTDPVIHYGVIATGSSVVKYAPKREEVRKKHNAICLEMEAAGLMNNFPCIVIRGISSYADSHKNDQWQRYAAATAAAYAKELLKCVQPRTLNGERTAKDILSQVLDGLSKIRDDVSKIGAVVNTGQTTILNWLATIDYGAQQSDFISRRQEGTGQWLLHSDEFRKWLNQSRQTLFCPGIPGAGKTIITSIVIEHIWAKFHNDPSVGVAYLYCNYKKEQKSVDLFASLLRQLIQERPSLPEIVKTLYERHKNKQTRPSSEEILTVLLSIAAHYSGIFIIIDALDECQISDGSRSQFLSQIFNLCVKTGANLFATSRFIPEITNHFKRSIALEVRASDGDMRRYLESRISHAESRIFQRPNIKEEIEAGIIKIADGVFLLAKLHLDSLIGVRSPRDIRAALNKLPTGSHAYDDAYHEAMVRVKQQDSKTLEFANRVLSWITCSKRPVTTSELLHALAVEIGAPELDEENFPEIEDMVSVCAGLVTIDEQSGIIRLVHYTTQEYFERTWSSWFPNAQTDITKTCVTYLSFSNFKSGFCPTDEEFEARLRSYVLYDYAARNWGHHARAASAEVEQLILDLLRDEVRVSSCSQAAMVSRRYHGYSQTFPKRLTGLHLAAYFGLKEATIALLKNGRYLNAKDIYGRTPLLWAAWNGHLEVLKLLLNKDGINRDSKDSDGRTPLSWAAWNGHLEVVKLLFNNDGVNPDSKDSFGRTPLLWAAEKGYTEVAKLLLNNDGVNPDSKDIYDRTPLSLAAEKGYTEVAKLLLNKDGVNPDSIDSFGRTPLSWAARNGHLEVLKLLLNSDGVNPDSKDSSGQTPLLWAAENRHVEVVKLLLNNDGVNPDSKDSFGRTPLLWAAENRHVEVVELLLNNDGVNPDSKDSFGRTPLLWAAENRHVEVVKLLLNNDGVNLDSNGIYGRTPLSWAAWWGNGEVVKLLLDKGVVDLNSKDSEYGQTPLSWAALNGHLEVVELLLNKDGIDPDAKDQNGWTPLSWAMEEGHEEVAKLLLEKGAKESH